MRPRASWLIDAAQMRYAVAMAKVILDQANTRQAAVH
jgi:hypothetical protein